MLALLLAAAVQCPDGAPPPCARAAPAVVATLAIDPHRIAVLPFRVTTADSLLGEGLAELIATEFTGENSPRAVNMGTVLRAWRTAGGGLRSPLAQDRAIRLARDMGAGLYVEGSVVGLGQRLTINASVVTVPGGEARRASAVSGPSDSLDVLVARVTSGLLASAGADRGVPGRARLTGSPAAMRSYLEGLAHWRRSRLQPAADAFERALADDSGFARAVFMRWAVGLWGIPGTGWEQRVLAARDRLAESDRLLVQARLGTGGPRTAATMFADRQRIAARLPESAEAQYFVGDWLFHYGRALDIDDHLERARVLFERSVALDSQGTVLQHLLELALSTRDTALARRVWPGYEHTVGGSWDWGMAIAALRGDHAMFAAQRRRASPIADRATVAYSLGDTGLPASVTDEIHRLVDSLSPPAPFVGFNFSPSFMTAQVQGRRALALRLLLARGDSMPTTRIDEVLVAAALYGDGDPGAGAAAVERLRRLTTSRDSVRAAGAQCAVAHWELSHAGSPAWDDGLLRRWASHCNAALTAARAVREHRPDALAVLRDADSTMHEFSAADFGDNQRLLARAWEEAGEPARALAMSRARHYGFSSQFMESGRVREEGRLALVAGDTAGAIRAWQRYLLLRQDAEPVLVPQRDSVRAELARLTRR